MSWLLLQFFYVGAAVLASVPDVVRDHEPPLCQNNQHVDGKWVVDDSERASSSRNFPCCAADYRENKWHNGSFALPHEKVCGGVIFPDQPGYHAMYASWYNGSKTHYAHFPSKTCSRQHYENLDAKDAGDLFLPRKRYSWVPNDCALPKFDGKKFCELLGKRKMLFVGDSTMQQTAGTLMSLILASDGDCAEQIIQGTTYYFAFNHQGTSKWWGYWEQVMPEFCIMNFGAWCQDPGDMYSIWTAVDLQVRERQGRGTKFVWKTLNPPHEGCTHIKEPYTELVETKSDTYGWKYWPEYDQMSNEFAKNLSMPIIDMHPLWLRPDAHVGSPSPSTHYDPNHFNDCLHYSIPGPINVFGDILLNMMVTGEL